MTAAVAATPIVAPEPDKRDRLLAACETLLQRDDWSTPTCQNAVLRIVALLWPNMAARRREYLLQHVHGGDLVTPEQTYAEWCRDQDFANAILQLLAAPDLPKEIRHFRDDMAKRSKWPNWNPSDKQVAYAISLANQWGVTSPELVE